MTVEELISLINATEDGEIWLYSNKLDSIGRQNKNHYGRWLGQSRRIPKTTEPIQW